MDRTIMFNASIIADLKRYLKDRKKMKRTCPYFFVSIRNNLKMDNSVLRRLLKKIQEASGMRIHAHKLRHTFATLSIIHGVHKDELQRQLGHRNPVSTNVYIHVCDPTLRKKVDEEGFRYTPCCLIDY